MKGQYIDFANEVQYLERMNLMVQDVKPLLSMISIRNAFIGVAGNS